MKWLFRVLLICCLCAGESVAAAPLPPVILVTTTSTQDTGLLDALIPVFEKKTGYFVKTIAVGSGQALSLGRRGEGDVLLVHDPAAEVEFMTCGYGIDRRTVMQNDFVIVGPPADPAAVRTTRSAREAFQRIAHHGALFISRGDHSGTHRKEQALWKAVGINPEGHRWYQQTGLGMGHTLHVAAEKKGYTLTDRGTYVSLQRRLDLEIVNTGDGMLLNTYSVIQVHPGRFRKINAAGAQAFADFLVGPEAQQIIGRFGIRQYGAPLFIPAAGRKGSTSRK